MTYEFKITTEALEDITHLTKTVSYYCAIFDIVQMLRDIDKHESSQERRNITYIRSKVFEILDSHNVKLMDWDTRMTVFELIKQLKEHDLDSNVFMKANDGVLVVVPKDFPIDYDQMEGIDLVIGLSL